MVSLNGGLTVSELLRGMEAGRMQSVGIMQVIPLTMDEGLWDDRFVGPKQGKVNTDSGYGNLEFKNPTDKTLLVPSHVGYVISKQGQDHAMSHAGMVKKKGSKLYDTACCIEASQGGAISTSDAEGMLILPYSLRERALEIRDIHGEYGKLWPEIESFNNSLGVHDSGGHLTLFLKKFKDQLDEFVAEFECVPRQCGAIILIDGHVVGFERAPSPTYWKEIWRALIRECYGSLSIQVRQDQNGRLPRLKTRIPLTSRGINSLDDLADALEKTRDKEEEKTKEIIRKLLGDPFELTEEEDVGVFKLLTIKNGQFTGQAIRDGDRVSYTSIFTTKDWAKNAPWRQASKFAL